MGVPSVVVSIGSSDVNLAAPTTQVNFTFSEAPIGFTLADTSATGGTLGSLVRLDATHYTATFTAAPGINITTAQIDVAEASYQGADGTPGTGGSTGSFTVDTVTPSVVVSIGSRDVTLAAPAVLVSFIFSAAPTGFTLDDTSATGGELSNLVQIDATHYTATFTATTGIHVANARVSIAGASWQDSNGNPGSAGSTGNFTVDTVAPGVAISIDSSDLNLAAPTALVSFTFSAAPTSFTLADTSASGGTLGDLVQLDATHYTAIFTATPGINVADAQVGVIDASWQDANGTPGTGDSTDAFIVDTVTPSVVVSIGSSDVNLAAPTALVSFTFSEAPATFTLADTAVTGGVLSDFVRIDATHYSATFTAAAGTDIADAQVNVTGASWAGINGNPGSTGSTGGFTVDTVTPGVAVSIDSTDVNLAASTALVSFTFTEAPVVFTLADTAATGGVLSDLVQVDALHYTATFAAAADTDIADAEVTVIGGSWQEANGNPGTGGTTGGFIVDTVTPSVAISVDSGDVNLAAPTAQVSFVFSEAPTGFTLADTNATGGVLSDLVQIDATRYSATFTAAAATDIANAQVDVIGAGWQEDNGNPGSDSGSAAFIVDTVTPTVAVSIDSGSFNLAAPTGMVSFAFSEAPVSFILADTSATGGALSDLVRVDSTHYTATFTAAAATDIANAVVSVAGGSWQEENGNPGAAGSTGSFIVDTVTPTVAVTIDSSDCNIAAPTATVSFAFSEAPTRFVLADTSAIGGALSNLVQVDATHFIATFTADGATDIANAEVSVVGASWQEENGNPGDAGSTGSFIVDTVAPTVAVSIDSSDVNLAAPTATVSFAFSEAPAGFTLDDTSATGGVLSDLVQVDSTHYSAVFTAASGTDIASADASVIGGGWQDLNGNPGGAGNTGSFIVDTVTPTVAVSIDSSDVNLAAPTAQVGFTFSEAPNSFTLHATSATGGALSNLMQVDATHYTATFTAAADTNIADAEVSVIGGSWQEATGNPGDGGSTGGFVVDTVTPGVAITIDNNDVNLATSTALVSFTFSEAPATFTLADTGATGGTLSNLVQIDATHYSATFTAAVATDIANAQVDVIGGVWQGVNGNPGDAGSSGSFTVDTVAPTVVVAIDSSDVNLAAPTAQVSFTFSEAPIGFTLDATSATGGTLSDLLQGDATHYTAIFTAAPGTNIADAAIDVIAAAWQDPNGNPGGTGSTGGFIVNTVTPGVAVSIDSANVNLAAPAALVSFTFSETPAAFALANTSASGGTLSDLVQIDAAHYSATFTAATGTDIADAEVSVIDGSWQGINGNTGTGGSSGSFVVDTVTPGVAVSIDSSDVNLAAPIALVSFAFSEAPVSFNLADTSATGGVLSDLVRVDATHYTATFTAAAGTDIADAVVSVTGGSWQEENGNPGASGSTGSFIVDTVTPTVAVTIDSSDCNIAAPIATVSFAFSEAPTGFALADTSAIGGALSNLVQVDATHFTATFTADGATDIANAEVSVVGASWQEENGNPGDGGSTGSFIVDTVTPTVAVSIDSSDVNLAAPIATVSFAFSEAPAAFTLAGASATGGVLSDLVQVDATHYTAAFTAAAATDIADARVNVIDSSWQGINGNPGAGGSSDDFIVDTVTPTVAVSLDSSDVNLAAPTALVSFTFSEAPTGFTLDATSVAGGALSNLVRLDATHYRATFTAAAGIDIANAQVSVIDGSWQEENGNPGTGGSTGGFVVDTLTPTVAVSIDSSDCNIASPSALVSFTFSEAPASFTLADTSATGGALSNLVQLDATHYTATFTAAAATNIADAEVSVIGASWQEENGNPGSAGSTGSFIVDTVTPSVAISIDSNDLNLEAATATVDFTFSEAPAAFTLADTSATGGTLSDLVRLDATHYTATFTASVGVSITNAMVGVADAGWQGINGNPGSAGSSSNFIVDTVAPCVVVSINSRNVNLAAPTAQASFTFSEAPTSFTLDNTTATGGTLSNLVEVDATHYTATFTAATATDITNGRVGVIGASWQDANGNPGSAGTTRSFIVDTVTPSVAVTIDSRHLNLAAPSALVSFTFSEAPTSFVLADTNVTGGALSNLVQVDATHYTATFTAAAATDIANADVSVIGARWQEADGNPGGSGSTGSFTVDTVAPGVTVSIDNSNLNLAAPTAVVGFAFSEAPTGFSLADTSATGGTLSNLVQLDATHYSATFTATSGIDIANAQISVAAAGWQDANGNPGGAGSTGNFNVDTPRVVVTIDNNNLNLAAPTALVGFAFSEAPTGFSLADISATGGTLGNLVRLDTTHYTATFTAAAGIDIADARIDVTDASWEEITSTFTVDTVAPGVVVSIDSSSVNLAAPTAQVSFIFSEAPTGFTLADTAATGGTLANLSQVDTTHYTATFTAAAATDISNAQVSVTGGTWQDAHGNTGSAGSTAGFVADTVAPSVAVAIDSSNVNLAAPTAQVSFIFSEAPTGFTLADTNATGGVLSNLALVDATHYTATFTAAAATDISNAQVSVTGGTWQDAHGNTGSAGSTGGFVVDTVTPSVAVSIDNSNVNLAAPTGLVSFTFSEAPTGFTLADTNATGGVLSNLALVDATHYTATFTAAPAIEIVNAQVSVTGGTWQDAHGNSGGAGSPGGFVVDTVTPSVAVSIDNSNVNLAAPTGLVSFTFSEAPTGFTLADTNATGGVLSNLALVDATHYTATFTAAPAIEIVNAQASVTGGTWQDAHGNSGGAGSTGTFTVDTAAPGVNSIGGTPSGNDLISGGTVTIALTMSEKVTVTGAPILTLNNGGTAAYASGGGSAVLIFNYTVVSRDTDVAALAVIGNNLNGTAIAIKDGAGNNTNLSGANVTLSPAVQIDTSIPTVTSVTASGNGINNGEGVLTTGATVTLTLHMSKAVAVAGGVPVLQLNDGGTAIYTGGSGTTALTFSHTVAAGQRADDLAVTGITLDGTTITDSAGNAANLGGAAANPPGTLQVSAASARSDFSGNGSSDILFRDPTTGTLGDFSFNNGQPTWASVGWADPNLQVAGTGDFTGGGTSDILFRDPIGGGLSMFVMNNNQPTWSNIGWAAPDLQIAGIGDFNGDGTSDILFRDPAAGGLSDFLMHDGQPTWADIGWADPGLRIAGVGDFNGDGTSDILFRDPTGGNLSMFSMHDNHPSWAAIGWAAPGLQIAGIGDFNGNGTDDILFRDPTGGNLSDFLMTSGHPTWASIGWASPALQVIGVGDYTGDGTADIMFRDTVGGGLGMFAMHNNQPTFSAISSSDPDLAVIGR